MKTSVSASTAESILFKGGIRVSEEGSMRENEAAWWEERGASRGGERGICTPECDERRVVCQKKI